MDSRQPLSLLWPDVSRRPQAGTTLDPQCVHDLEWESTITTLIGNPLGRSTLRETFLTLCREPEVILYRQDILDDLWQNPAFVAQLEMLLPDLGTLEASQPLGDRRRSPLLEVSWRLGELERLVTCVSGLSAVFEQLGDKIQAAGWRALRQVITQTAHEPLYHNLCRELPAMLQTMRAKASVTIGVNLDGQLQPMAATLLAVNDQKFAASTFLDRLFGRHGDPVLFKGLGPLHTVPALAQSGGAPGHPQGNRDVNPLMVPLFRDVAKVLDTVCQPIAQALRQYNAMHSGFLAALSGDMTFYLAAVRLIERLSHCGLPMCRPAIAPMAERRCELQEAYNLNLALRHLEHADGASHLVTNDVHSGDQGRIGIITGPNQGGKTTYAQMVGLCQVLAQLGLWVPARSACISPVDNIYTHYPVTEQAAAGTGRFGEEAQRLSQIFARGTRHSLILLNESLASTNAGESVYIAQDIVRILRRMGARALFATHLHELAADVATLNANTAGDSLIVSLVASRSTDGGSAERSYKIVPGQPMGRSYAQEIAARYGISYDQLSVLLQQRGVLES